MSSKSCAWRLQSLRVFLLRLCLALPLTFGGSIASAVPVSLLIDNTIATPQVYFEDTFVYSPAIQTAPGRVTVTGGLDGLRKPVSGKFAVVLLGFKDDIVLLDSLLGAVTTYPDPSNPAVEEIFHLFKVDFYSDPQGLGFDPVALLDGYSTTFLSKTVANTCPFREGLCWAFPDGYFDLAVALGFDDGHGLMIGVKAELLPEPGSALLLLGGLLGLGITSRRRIYQLVNLQPAYSSSK